MYFLPESLIQTKILKERIFNHERIRKVSENVFYAAGGLLHSQHLDPDEFLQVERVPFDEMVHRCLTGEIEDAKTVAAVLKAKLLLEI